MYRRDVLKGILSIPFISQLKLEKESGQRCRIFRIKGDDDLLISLANKGPVLYRDFIITRPLYIKKHWILKHCMFRFQLVDNSKQPAITIYSGVTYCTFDFSWGWEKLVNDKKTKLAKGL